MSEPITEWQRRFWAQPRIWYTVDTDGMPLRFYESEEAARTEVLFYLKRGERIGIGAQPIHDLALAAERWKTED